MEQFIVGFVRGSHGISGEFKVESSSGYYDHFEQMTEVTLRNPGTGDSRLFKVESVKNGSQSLYMKLEGINTPEEVQKYNKCEIVVPRNMACPLDENEWYVEDLKKCSLVYFGENEYGLADKSKGKSAPITVGTITDVMEGGSGDLLEVRLAEDCNLLSDEVKYGSEKNPEKRKVRTVYVPLNGDAGFIGKVDVKNKMIQLMHLWILE